MVVLYLYFAQLLAVEKREITMEEIRSIKVKTNNLNEMISMIKKGLPAETVVTLSTSLDMSIKATAELTNIAESTLARRRREKGKLRASESDRVVRIARLRDRAVVVLEEEQRANRWFKTPLKALHGCTPLEYAESELGAQEVMNLLGRLEHGVFS